MSRIQLKYHTIIKFYTQYTHPTLICRGADTQTDARTDGRMENIYSIFRDKLLLLGEHVSGSNLAIWEWQSCITATSTSMAMVMAMAMALAMCHRDCRWNNISSQARRIQWQRTQPFARLRGSRFSKLKVTSRNSSMEWVTQNGEQHVLMIFYTIWEHFRKRKNFKNKTMWKDQNSTNNSKRKHVNSLSLSIILLQHIYMIAMKNTTCNHKQSCCTVTYCHLVSAWATTIHKFHGF